MNEFGAKKTGEVIAFLHIGQQFLDKGGSAGRQAFGTQAADFAKRLENLRTQSEQLFVGDSFKEKIKSKVEATTTKVSDMMHLYVGDEWDNPTELLEWSGFYAGAGAVHAALLDGYFTAVGNKVAAQWAQETKLLFEDWLQVAATRLAETGTQHA